MKELIINYWNQFGIVLPIMTIMIYAVNKYFTDKDLVKKITETPTSVLIILISAYIGVMVVTVWLSIKGSSTNPMLVKSWVDFIIYSLFMTGTIGFAAAIPQIDLPERITGIVSDLILLLVSILTIPISSDLISFLRS